MFPYKPTPIPPIPPPYSDMQNLSSAAQRALLRVPQNIDIRPGSGGGGLFQPPLLPKIWATQPIPGPGTINVSTSPEYAQDVVSHERTHAIGYALSEAGWSGPNAYALATPQQRAAARASYVVPAADPGSSVGKELFSSGFPAAWARIQQQVAHGLTTLTWATSRLPAKQRYGEFFAETLQNAKFEYGNLPTNLRPAYAAVFDPKTVAAAPANDIRYWKGIGPPPASMTPPAKTADEQMIRLKQRFVTSSYVPGTYRDRASRGYSGLP